MHIYHGLEPIFAEKLAGMKPDQQQCDVEQVHGVLPYRLSIIQGLLQVTIWTRLMGSF